MTSETPDIIYPIAVEEHELEMLLITSVRTLKCGNKNVGTKKSLS